MLPHVDDRNDLVGERVRRERGRGLDHVEYPAHPRPVAAHVVVVDGLVHGDVVVKQVAPEEAVVGQLFDGRVDHPQQPVGHFLRVLGALEQHRAVGKGCRLGLISRVQDKVVHGDDIALPEHLLGRGLEPGRAALAAGAVARVPAVIHGAAPVVVGEDALIVPALEHGQHLGIGVRLDVQDGAALNAYPGVVGPQLHEHVLVRVAVVMAQADAVLAGGCHDFLELQLELVQRLCRCLADFVPDHLVVHAAVELAVPGKPVQLAVDLEALQNGGQHLIPELAGPGDGRGIDELVPGLQDAQPISPGYVAQVGGAQVAVPQQLVVLDHLGDLGVPAIGGGVDHDLVVGARGAQFLVVVVGGVGHVELFPVPGLGQEADLFGSGCYLDGRQDFPLDLFGDHNFLACYHLCHHDRFGFSGGGAAAGQGGARDAHGAHTQEIAPI